MIMQLYPAIDLKNGQCVRLRQGAFKDITVYSKAPEAVAAYWQEQGGDLPSSGGFGRGIGRALRQ